MTGVEPFVFGVPLIACAAARDWARVDHLLALTLRSVLAQTDADFRLILAAHEPPPAWTRLVGGDPRFELLLADWPARPPTPANDDGGMKKWRIKARVRELGGGLLMFLDADDWVDRDLVAAARREIGPDHIGGLITRGVALDLATRRAAPFPLGGGFDHAFHELCGSSTVARVDPASDDPVRRDPHAALGSHGDWEANAASLGLRLTRLGVEGVYVVGTGQSHSESDGPYAPWRRDLVAHVRRWGASIDGGFASRFGQGELRGSGTEVRLDADDGDMSGGAILRAV